MNEYPSFWSLAAVADYLHHPRAPFALHHESVFNYWRLRFKNRYLSIKRLFLPEQDLFPAFPGMLLTGFGYWRSREASLRTERYNSWSATDPAGSSRHRLAGPPSAAFAR